MNRRVYLKLRYICDRLRMVIYVNHSQGKTFHGKYLGRTILLLVIFSIQHVKTILMLRLTRRNIHENTITYNYYGISSFIR